MTRFFSMYPRVSLITPGTISEQHIARSSDTHTMAFFPLTYPVADCDEVAWDAKTLHAINAFSVVMPWSTQTISALSTYPPQCSLNIYNKKIENTQFLLQTS